MKEIPLTMGLVALIDDDDYDRVSASNWHASKTETTHYARRNTIVNGKRKTERMHRFILKLTCECIDDGEGET